MLTDHWTSGNILQEISDSMFPSITFYRILSECLGLENMMAVVCKTYEGVMALEKYNKDGMIERRSGLNGLGLSVARNIQGRYLVYCIENLRQVFMN